MQQLPIKKKAFAMAALATLLLGAGVGTAQADVCDAPYMHNGGFVQYTGAGNLQLGADLSFSEVTRSKGGSCRARVQGTATFSYAGLPPSRSKLDYLMTVANGQATFVRYDKAGGQPGDDGPFDLRMLGLFAYENGIKSAGQTFPGASYKINIGKDAPVQGASGTVIRVGQKTVGQRQNIDTVQGSLSCWPITYDRNSDASYATFRNITLPIPALTTKVTDWYCPKPGMVMKQDIAQGSSVSTVRVTALR